MKNYSNQLSNQKLSNACKLRSQVNNNSKNQRITLMKILDNDQWKNYEDFDIINPNTLFGGAVPDLSNGMRMNCQVLIRKSDGETYLASPKEDFVIIKNGEHLLAKSYINNFDPLAKKSVFNYGGLNIWGENQANNQYPLDRVFNTLDGNNYSGSEDQLTINLYIPETKNRFELLAVWREIYDTDNKTIKQTVIEKAYTGDQKYLVFKKDIDYGDKITFNQILVFGDLKTPSPTASPTISPTASPTVSPTNSPTASPTISPTFSPTKSPTPSPTVSPTSSPTSSPTVSPTLSPSFSPTSSPTQLKKIQLTSLVVSNIINTINKDDSYFNNYIKLLFYNPFTFEYNSRDIKYDEENCIIKISIKSNDNFILIGNNNVEKISHIIYDIQAQILSDLINLLKGLCIEKDNLSIHNRSDELKNKLYFEITIKNVSYLDLDSFKLTESPTSSPTLSPTYSPTVSPTSRGSKSPTISPTASPSVSPTLSPTASPSVSPTLSPTASPTESPTEPPYCEVDTPQGKIFIYPGIDLSNIDLSFIDLRGCDLIKDCNLTNTILTGIIVDEKTNFTGCILNGVISGKINSEEGLPILPLDINGNKLWDIKQGYLLGPGANIKDSSNENVDLSGEDLSNLTLIGANLIDIIITGCNVNNTHFSSASFAGITSGNVIGNPKSLPINWKLINGYFIGPGANLIGANLSNSNLSNSILRPYTSDKYGERITTLENANLESSILNTVDIEKVNFKNTNLSCIKTKNLTGKPNLETFPDGFIFDKNGYPIKGYFIGPDIDLSYSNLSNTDLSGANLAGTKLNDSNLDYCDLRKIRFDPEIVRNGKLVNTNFTNTNFTGSNLSYLSIKNSIFINANFTCAILSYAVIDSSVDLSTAKLNGAIGLDTMTGLNLEILNSIEGYSKVRVNIKGDSILLNKPGGIAISGNYMYFADTNNNIIRRTTLDEPYFTTIIAGNAQYQGTDYTDGQGNISKFFKPNTLKIYGENLYVIDQEGLKIRKISLEEPFMVTTILTISDNSEKINDFIINNGNLILLGKNMSVINHESQKFTYTAFALDKYHNVGIGLSKPEVKFQVSGKVRFSNLGESVINSGSSVAGISCNAKGDLLYESSDIKLKEDIMDLNGGLSIVKQLKPRNYRWKSSGSKEIGFIAQEIGDVIPTALKTNPNGYCNYNDRAVLSYAIKAIQELNGKIDEQNQKYIDLENKYHNLINSE